MDIGTGENILKPFKTQEVLDLDAKLKVAVEALEMYANKDNWTSSISRGSTKDSLAINDFTRESNENDCTILRAGKCAREALEKIRK